MLLLPLLWAGSLAQSEIVRLQVQESLTVQEGLCVHVSCTVLYPHGWNDSTPAHGYWFQEGANPSQYALVATNNPGRKVQGETKGRFHFLGEPWTYNCSLDIRDDKKMDNGRYFFWVDTRRTKWNYESNPLSVHVTNKEWAPSHATGEGHGGHGAGLGWDTVHGRIWGYGVSGLRERS
ncbi:hypothetical protein HPG69_014013 [Diceros bicornis minor]|uniref:Immunoglobulin V-set domain-containing protein n=1 Tax=Diceros bicornis minor TaxID=77932 RepID=A0A7J7EN14_DICBM|nr:hypothetical protein HPG69_014013 [Diceros bicornis minor]